MKKIPWAAVFQVLKAVYIAFLKGKIVHLPGGIGDVTLPSQGHTVPRNFLAMEWSSDQDRRAPRPAPRADGLPEPVPPPVPLSTSTLGIILFVVFGLPIVALTILGVLEWRTLSDNTPGNHVTATLRAAWSRAPGAVFLVSLVWCCFLVAIAMGLASHAWFQ